MWAKNLDMGVQGKEVPRHTQTLTSRYAKIFVSEHDGEVGGIVYNKFCFLIKSCENVDEQGTRFSRPSGRSPIWSKAQIAQSRQAAHFRSPARDLFPTRRKAHPSFPSISLNRRPTKTSLFPKVSILPVKDVGKLEALLGLS